MENNKFDQKVYKKDSSGKIRILHVYTEGADLIQKSGVINGALVEHRSTCVGKNIGKANETTPEEQAVLEAASKIETKRSTGYFDTIEEATNENVILPMLAKDYKKEFKKVKFPCYVQPKLDGMRALGNKAGNIFSRKGKHVDTMKHIQKDLNDLLCVDFLDGELYAHGLSFQENMKIIKKYRKGETEKVVYHVYDMALPNMSFGNRITLLKSILDAAEYPSIELVPTYKVNSEDDIKKYHSQFISEGYEGTIIRHSEEGYAINKRSSQLLKYKDFIDIDLVIKDVIPMDKTPEQGTCIFDWKGAKGHPLGDDILGCGMKFSHLERAEILKNKQNYVGKVANVRFFEYSDEGIPRFPVMIGIHEDR